MKKILREEEFPKPIITLAQAIDNDIFMDYLIANGNMAANIYGDTSWQWIRKECTPEDVNYTNHDDLIEKALKQFNEYFSTNSMPGSVPGCGVPIDGYNTFARWGKWKGGYVANLGWVSEPSASVYGASLYINSSWTEQGGSETPLTEGRFYAIQEHNTWQGGYVDGWGYVSTETKILGATISNWFINGNASDMALVNLLNFRLFADSNPAAYSDLSALQQEFAKCWDENTHRYEIDDVELLRYLRTQYQGHQVAVSNIREALAQHRAVFLRVVKRVVSSSEGVDKRYGDDYVILYYNALMRTYGFIDPVSGKVSEIDAVSIDNRNADIIIFACERRTTA